MWKPDDKFITFKRILMNHANDLKASIRRPDGREMQLEWPDLLPYG
jgi:hypothetical protein